MFSGVFVYCFSNCKLTALTSEYSETVLFFFPKFLQLKLHLQEKDSGAANPILASCKDLPDICRFIHAFFFAQ